MHPQKVQHKGSVQTSLERILKGCVSCGKACEVIFRLKITNFQHVYLKKKKKRNKRNSRSVLVSIGIQGTGKTFLTL